MKTHAQVIAELAQDPAIVEMAREIPEPLEPTQDPHVCEAALAAYLDFGGKGRPLGQDILLALEQASMDSIRTHGLAASGFRAGIGEE